MNAGESVPELLFVNGLVRRTAVRLKMGIFFLFFLIQPSNRFHGVALGFFLVGDDKRKVRAVRKFLNPVFNFGRDWVGLG